MMKIVWQMPRIGNCWRIWLLHSFSSWFCSLQELDSERCGSKALVARDSKVSPQWFCARAKSWVGVLSRRGGLLAKHFIALTSRPRHDLAPGLCRVFVSV